MVNVIDNLMVKLMVYGLMIFHFYFLALVYSYCILSIFICLLCLSNLMLLLVDVHFFLYRWCARHLDMLLFAFLFAYLICHVVFYSLLYIFVFAIVVFHVFCFVWYICFSFIIDFIRFSSCFLCFCVVLCLTVNFIANLMVSA